MAIAANGSTAVAEGISVSIVDGALNNSGTLSIEAIGDTSADARGIEVRLLDGHLANSGTITATAQGSYANAEGIDALFVGGSHENSGSIAVSAKGTASAAATGLAAFNIGGQLINSGTISVSAEGSVADAHGIKTGSVDGLIANSGDIRVSATGQSSASTAGIVLRDLDGQFSNVGDISVQAIANKAYVDGIDVRKVTGTLVNTAHIAVVASGQTSAHANGIDLRQLDGQVTTSGSITASANGQMARADGIEMDDVVGSFTNSGNLSVRASGTSTADATGIEVDIVSGTFSNSGSISANVSGVGGTSYSSYGMKIDEIDAAGVLTHSGSIISSAQGPTAEAYGLHVTAARGTINLKGDIAASSSGLSYGVYLGDGGGTLNVDTTANIDGTIRISDHNVNLENVGGKVVYRFQDDDTSNGVFTTSGTSASQGWFVDGEGGAAPVYASIDASELQPNTNQSFEIAGLSYDLARQLGGIGGDSVSRDRMVLSTRGSGAIEGFRPYFLVSGSRSDGTSSGNSAALSSNMWSTSAGLTRDLGAGFRFGFGASYLKNNGTLGSVSFDTSGVFLSASAAQNFGFADLSFGLGYGNLDHSETQSSGNSPSEAHYSSDMITALVAAQRDYFMVNGAILTPRASFLYGEQNLDGYTETGSSPNATVGERAVSFSEARIGGAYAVPIAGGSLSASLTAVHRDANAPSVTDVAIFGNSLSLASGGSGSDTFGEVGLSYEKSFDHGGILRLDAKSTVGADVSTQAMWASYEWHF